MSYARRDMLPGIRFVDAPPPAERALPRMDVVGLAGFASAGPVGVPVAVEDLQRFREIFGPDLTLAWDPAAQAPATSRLGAAVEQVFRNGGRRAWIVRVAGDGAETRTFPVPGLLTTSGAAARVQARAPGSWADRLHVGARRQATPLPVRGFEIAESPSAFPYRISLGVSDRVPQRGDLIELRFPGLSLRAYMFAEQVVAEPGGLRFRAAEAHWFEVARPASASPDTASDDAAETLLPLPVAMAETLVGEAGSPEPLPDAVLLHFELLAWENDALVARIGDLAFAPEHPRFWGRLPSDEDLFGRVLALHDGALGQPLDPLWTAALTPRFPFAGATAGRTLPIGMAARRSPRDGLSHDPVSGGPGSGDGVDDFTAAPFLDADLAPLGLRVLLAEARHKAEVLGRPLDGIHAFLRIPEVSMIAVPDAGQRQWDRRPRSPGLPLPAPHLDPLAPLAEAGWWTVSWSPVAGATGYVLEWATDPDFADRTRTEIAPPDLLTLFEPGEAPAPDTETVLELGDGCDGVRHVRVRATGPDGQSAWSNTRALLLPPGGFRRCGTADPNHLELRLDIGTAPDPLSRTLFWTAATPPLDTALTGYTLQVADDPDFLGAGTQYSGTETDTTVQLDGGGRIFLRVRAETDAIPGPWSNTVLIDPVLLRVPTLVTEAEHAGDDLLAVHTALLRLCAARAECLALLSLPRHFRLPEAAGHVDALRPVGMRRDPFAGSVRVPPLSDDEARALDHGLMLHPWLRFATDRDGARLLVEAPPDGALLGLAAAAARERGAWYSPANTSFADVLGLAPNVSAEDFAGFHRIGVDLVLPGPRGIRLAVADTLSQRPERTSFSVRRTLDLILRLARAEGDRHVFEPNSAPFRAAVLSDWETLLGELHLRGALRGATRAEAFAVIVDPTGEAARDPDLGRLVIELRVAPAEPLRFIDIRLVRNGLDGIALVEG